MHEIRSSIFFEFLSAIVLIVFIYKPFKDVMSKRIILISCVSKKLTYGEKARSLYTSTLFKYNLKYAESLEPDHIFILSAKYGLLTLDQIIEPYEQTLNNMTASDVRTWANKVLEQIQLSCNIDDTEFTFLAGQKYRMYLAPHLNKVKIPLEGLRIGEQLQKLKGLIS